MPFLSWPLARTGVIGVLLSGICCVDAAARDTGYPPPPGSYLFRPPYDIGQQAATLEPETMAAEDRATDGANPYDATVLFGAPPETAAEPPSDRPQSPGFAPIQPTDTPTDVTLDFPRPDTTPAGIRPPPAAPGMYAGAAPPGYTPGRVPPGFRQPPAPYVGGYRETPSSAFPPVRRPAFVEYGTGPRRDHRPGMPPYAAPQASGNEQAADLRFQPATTSKAPPVKPYPGAAALFRPAD